MEHQIFYPSLRPAGVPSWNESSGHLSEPAIDLNKQLIQNESATFLMRVNSDAMAEAGISRGDVVIVDRAAEVRSGKIVIALVGEEMVIRRLEISQGKQKLLPASQKLSAIDIDPIHTSIWGVVTYVIRKF